MTWWPTSGSAGLSVVVVVVPFARVGLLSDAGSVLGVRAAVMVIGERPGLSAPDNLSIYVEVDPRPGHTDADRNCLSNIRPEGLSPTLAAAQATQLIQAGLVRAAAAPPSASSSIPWSIGALRGCPNRDRGSTGLLASSSGQSKAARSTSATALRGGRIATWNINSVNRRIEHVTSWLETAQPDIVCLQETKCATGAFPT